ncbi:hypothetical protein L0U89_02215 [Mariniradius sp. RY-2]|uniref:Uncharacterized protein n=1 Tax=Mariniradius sediminis TaxID=2909237 RepID=A0ABS9BQC6_9BACT|nr:hypothetical protein [Mariniradius sediminis]
MKIPFLLLPCMLAFFCPNFKNSERIELRKVDFGITSIFTVHCDGFEGFFDDEMETVVISREKEIERTKEAISNLEIDTSNYQADVRAKLLFFHDDNTVDTVCMSSIGVVLNGKSYKPDSAFVKIIEEY